MTDASIGLYCDAKWSATHYPEFDRVFLNARDADREPLGVTVSMSIAQARQLFDVLREALDAIEEPTSAACAASPDA